MTMDYDFLSKTPDIPGHSFTSSRWARKEATPSTTGVRRRPYTPRSARLYGYNDMADAKALLSP